jgi:PII-like signaling protein
MRELKGDHTLLRIFIGEADKAGHKPLYMELLERARAAGLAGCTVLRGIAGFGAASIVHAGSVLKLSPDLPIVIEIVDTTQNVRDFLKEVEPLLKGGLVTEEKAVVHRYRSSMT